ncbi:MAG TPA: nucleotide sugar dehydrogenase [Planctomycetota bacterium]|nr:nucleotide sugar dehydrogenase [Planctomycetota bacterium]
MAALARGETPLRHLDPALGARLAASGRFEACTDARRMSEADALLLCVPTGLTAADEPDLGPVRAAAEAAAATLRRGQLVVLESTTYPGTTRDVVLPILARAGLACGRDWFLAYSPERVDPGRTDPPLRAVPRLVGGVDAPSLAAAARLYRAISDTVVELSSAEAAEAAKLLENVYRAVNIAMANEMKLLLTAMGLDVREVIDAAATKPYGFTKFEPGPGPGGHCIPIDPVYLAWKARQIGQEARFVALATAINRAMPAYVIGRLEQALADRGRRLAGSRVLLIGLAYKAGLDDTRESPGWTLMLELLRRDARVDYHDPHVPRTPDERPAGVPELRSVARDERALAAHDAVVIATAHEGIDWDLVARASRLVIDTRSALRGHAGDNIVTA